MCAAMAVLNRSMRNCWLQILIKKRVVKYLDRFLMFYIKTADQLTRTATWLNKLDGGMSYLKNVI
jgi:NAD(P)H-nitrite reductase large subunit